MNRGRQGHPPGRLEDAQVAALGPEWTDIRRDTSVYIGAANGVVLLPVHVEMTMGFVFELPTGVVALRPLMGRDA